jgi:hypothetical protein
MVEISLSGSGEGPQAETPGAYSTCDQARLVRKEWRNAVTTKFG